MRLIGITGVSVTLSPVGYQFPSMADGGWNDLNWLVVRGEVETPDGAWAFEDPCLQTTEAQKLGGWLEDLAGGEVGPTPPDQNGNVWPDLAFVEPNVAFGVEAVEAGDVILRIYFSLESAPPWSTERHAMSHQFYVRCWVSQDALRAAARDWRAATARFLERGERYW